MREQSRLVALAAQVGLVGLGRGRGRVLGLSGRLESRGDPRIAALGAGSAARAQCRVTRLRHLFDQLHCRRLHDGRGLARRRVLRAFPRLVDLLLGSLREISQTSPYRFWADGVFRCELRRRLGRADGQMKRRQITVSRRESGRSKSLLRHRGLATPAESDDSRELASFATDAVRVQTWPAVCFVSDEAAVLRQVKQLLLAVVEILGRLVDLGDDCDSLGLLRGGLRHQRHRLALVRLLDQLTELLLLGRRRARAQLGFFQRRCGALRAHRWLLEQEGRRCAACGEGGVLLATTRQAVSLALLLSLMPSFQFVTRFIGSLGACHRRG